MSQLSKLIALQKGAPKNVDHADSNQPAVQQPSSPVGTETGSGESAESSGVPSAEPAQETPAAKPAGGLGLNRLGATLARGSSAPAAPRTPVIKPAGRDPASADLGVGGSADFSLDDLAQFDATNAPELRAHEPSGFSDEILATAPDRDLPADLTSQQLGFVEQLDGIYGILHDPDMFAQSVRIVMMELQENPEYIKLVSDPDVHTMIRGMRNSMGLARAKKQEKSRKTGGASKASARKKSTETDAALALLDSLGLDDD